MPKKILELSTLTPDRLAIGIDGKLYELKDRSEMGIEDIVILQSLYSEISAMQALSSAAEITEEVGRDLAHAMDKLCRLLLIDCPSDIHAKLKDHHRLSIFQAFQEAAGEETTPDSQPPNRETRRRQKTST